MVSGTVEELVARVDALPADAKALELWVPDRLSLKGKPVPQDLAMAIVVDRLLGRGLYPNGFVQGDGGRTYRYSPQPPP